MGLCNYVLRISFIVSLRIMINSELLSIHSNSVQALNNNSNTETVIQPVYYTNLSPCGCDRIADYCDALCCCDQSCTSDQKMSMRCGDAEEELYPSSVHLCSAIPNVIRRQELFLLLCIYDAQTPHLGYFNQPPPIIRESQIYNQKLTKYTDKHQGFKQAFIDLPQGVEYSYGVPVQTGMYFDKIGSGFGWLTLPGHSLGINYDCTDKPIEYLFDSDQQCSTVVSNDSCVNKPQISALYYLIPTPGSGESRVPSPRVVADGGDGVMYLSMDDLIIKYFQVKQDPVLTSSIGEGGDLFWYSKLHRIYENRDFLFNAEPFPIRQTFRAPQPPFIDERHCNNTVVAVRYEIFWNASSISSIEASIVLNSIPLNTRFDQTFQVIWNHRGVGQSEGTQQMRSGNPGYSVGNPLLGAVQTSSDSLLPVFVSSKLTQVYNIIPDVSNWCNSSERSIATFGENRASACFISINISSFSNCSKLRNTITSGLKSLIQATHISKTGILNLQIPDSFIRILSLPPANDSDDPNTIFGFSPETDDNVTLKEQECFNIPHHIALDIMYTQAGLINALPIYEIVGAFTFFNFTFWRYRDNEDKSTNQFFITSSIRFVEKPAYISKHTKSYNLREHRERCPSAWCWDQMFYPFLEATPGDHLYTLYMGLSTILIISLMYFLTQPWRM